MDNNFGLKSRCMKKSGNFALRNSVKIGNLSFSSVDTIRHRWNKFCQWLKENQAAKKLEEISFQLVCSYGQELLIVVEEEDMAVSTAQNYVSAVNTVMDLATRGHWKSVSPTKDCGIPLRSLVRTTIPASLNRDEYTDALVIISAQLGNRAVIVAELCREFGLRSKEASLMDAKSLVEMAKFSGFVIISGGTKGGRSRTLPILSESQICLLNRAATVQSNDKSLIPSNLSWRQWREGDLRKIRELIQKTLGASGLHDLRAAYACERYETLTGFKAPLFRSEKAGKFEDMLARQIIAEELGHGRTEITNSYCGGKK